MLTFLASAITFILATVIEGVVIARIGVVLHSVFFEYKDVAVANKLPLLYDNMRTFDLVCMWASSFEVRICNVPQVKQYGVLKFLCCFQVIISDGIVVWRAFVLLQHRRRWIILPLLLLLVSISM